MDRIHGSTVILLFITLTHTCAHACMHTRTHARMHACTHAHTHTHTLLHTQTSTHTQTHNKHTHTHTYIAVHIHPGLSHYPEWDGLKHQRPSFTAGPPLKGCVCVCVCVGGGLCVSLSVSVSLLYPSGIRLYCNRFYRHYINNIMHLFPPNLPWCVLTHLTSLKPTKTAKMKLETQSRCGGERQEERFSQSWSAHPRHAHQSQGELCPSEPLQS